MTKYYPYPVRTSVVENGGFWLPGLGSVTVTVPSPTEIVSLAVDEIDAYEKWVAVYFLTPAGEALFAGLDAAALAAGQVTSLVAATFRDAFARLQKMYELGQVTVQPNPEGATFMAWWKDVDPAGFSANMVYASPSSAQSVPVLTAPAGLVDYYKKNPTASAVPDYVLGAAPMPFTQTMLGRAVLVGGLCVGGYYLYKWYENRKQYAKTRKE